MMILFLSSKRSRLNFKDFRFFGCSKSKTLNPLAKIAEMSGARRLEMQPTAELCLAGWYATRRSPTGQSVAFPPPAAGDFAQAQAITFVLYYCKPQLGSRRKRVYAWVENLKTMWRGPHKVTQGPVKSMILKRSWCIAEQMWLVLVLVLISLALLSGVFKLDKIISPRTPLDRKDGQNYENCNPNYCRISSCLTTQYLRPINTQVMLRWNLHFMLVMYAYHVRT